MAKIIGRIGYLIAERALIRRCIIVWIAYSMGDLIQVITRKIEDAPELTDTHATIIGIVLGLCAFVFGWRYSKKGDV